MRDDEALAGFWYEILPTDEFQLVTQRAEYELTN
jgi:hypothetical protein